MKKKGKPWSQHINIYGLGKMIAKLQIRGKSVKEFVICGSKCNPKLSKVCKRCNDYRRFENERRERGEFKEEWYWNEYLIIRKWRGRY